MNIITPGFYYIRWNLSSGAFLNHDEVYLARLTPKKNVNSFSMIIYGTNQGIATGFTFHYETRSFSLLSKIDDKILNLLYS